MSRIGRNDPCYCGSGKKFKKCCYGKTPQTAETPAQDAPSPSIHLREEITKTQEAAVAKKNSLRTLGVFIFLTTDEGDGWLLEITAMDALHVAKAGEKLDFELTENPETIEINWTHSFSFEDKQFVVFSYKDKTKTTCPSYPAARIKNVLKKERAKIPPEILAQLHLDTSETEEEQEAV